MPGCALLVFTAQYAANLSLSFLTISPYLRLNVDSSGQMFGSRACGLVAPNVDVPNVFAEPPNRESEAPVVDPNKLLDPPVVDPNKLLEPPVVDPNKLLEPPVVDPNKLSVPPVAGAGAGVPNKLLVADVVDPLAAVVELPNKLSVVEVVVVLLPVEPNKLFVPPLVPPNKLPVSPKSDIVQNCPEQADSTHGRSAFLAFQHKEGIREVTDVCRETQTSA